MRTQVQSQELSESIGMKGLICSPEAGVSRKTLTAPSEPVGPTPPDLRST